MENKRAPQPAQMEEMTWQEELQELAEQALALLPQSVREFCREKAREIIAATAVVAMLALLIYGYSAFTTMREERAATAVGAALHAAKPQDRIQGLEQVVKEYGSTDAAGQALLLLGSLYDRQGDHEKAMEYYRRAGQRYGAQNPLGQAAEMGRGYIFEKEGKEGEAKGVFQGLSGKKGPYRPVALLDYARAARLTGDTDSALAALNRYISLEPTAQNLDYVRYQIVAMAGEEEAKAAKGGAKAGPKGGAQTK